MPLLKISFSWGEKEYMVAKDLLGKCYGERHKDRRPFLKQKKGRWNSFPGVVETLLWRAGRDWVSWVGGGTLLNMGGG